MKRQRKGDSELHYGDLLSSARSIAHLQDVRWVEEQLGLLGTLLPDLIAKLPRMKAALLLALVKDTQVESPACMQGNVQGTRSHAHSRKQAMQHNVVDHIQGRTACTGMPYNSRVRQCTYLLVEAYQSCVSGCKLKSSSAASGSSQDLKALNELI